MTRSSAFPVGVMLIVAPPLEPLVGFDVEGLFRLRVDLVVVVDGGGSTESALMGDIIAAKGARNGWAGVVILGAIRDSAAVGAIDFGVKALGTNPAKSAKLGDGEVDAPVEFGGVVFEPGHWVYCDEDGILVSATEIS